eukprot:CAMPEP_0177648268 /NCGR_PEP_ID=MMETSP0447-20121125/10740_1 /TAXON_ID=0 /ORGANISM="Stygamoeba regulata, Strain BSH-02190019" /LENGTH=295 /DNA_ID=CAMNT_0019150903 /DNA_START=25 /DNA_END=915 /DNA_ORIENTATION=+
MSTSSFELVKWLDQTGGAFIFQEENSLESHSGWWGRELDPNRLGEMGRGIVLWMLVTLLATAALDQLLVRWLFRRDETTTRRWFLLHVVFNAYVVLHTCPYIATSLFFPYDVYLPEVPYTFVSQFSTTAIAAFHLYHALFFPLTTEDIWHHLINTGVVVVVGVAFPFSYGLCLCNFIMCGLPGGIDYLLLVLVKSRMMPRMREKFLNLHLNMLVRYPGMLLTTWAFLLAVAQQRVRLDAISVLPTTLTLVLMLIGAFLHTANAYYFCQKVVGNYHVCSKEERQRADQSSKTIKQQ